MQCFMCHSAEGKLQMIQTDLDNNTVKRIKIVLPDFLIPESMDSVFICSTCLEQILFFSTLKKASLQNCSRLKHFNAVLKETDNVKCNDIRIIINSDKVSAQSKCHIEFKVNTKSKYLLSSGEQIVSHIKEEDKEYDHCSQQLVNEETSLNHLGDNESSCSSDDSTQHHVNLGSFEFVDTNKFTEKDYNLPSNNSRHKDQQKTQGESQDKRFKCTECHKTFTQRSNLKRHILVHTGEKPFKCTTCQKTFTQRSTLNTHKLTHTGEKPHECDVCHKTFNRSNNLIVHKRLHNVRPFQCAVCSKGFTTSSCLTVHMRSHTGKKPHQCHLCEYKCAYACSLNRHIRSHTGEKPYSCKHCEKSFTATTNLKNHEHRHHSNEDSK